MTIKKPVGKKGITGHSSGIWSVIQTGAGPTISVHGNIDRFGSFAVDLPEIFDKKRGQICHKSSDLLMFGSHILPLIHC